MFWQWSLKLVPAAVAQLQRQALLEVAGEHARRVELLDAGEHLLGFLPAKRIQLSLQRVDLFALLLEAGADPSHIMDSLRDIERAVTELGFVGVHLYPQWFGEAPDHAKYYPFYAKCVELDVPIMLQVGHCLDYMRDRVLPSVGRPIALDQVAIDFPDLKLIGIHLGWPWTEEMIAVSYKHRNVYICADAYGPKHWPKEFVHYADRWRPEKALWGSDWPAVDPVRSVREVEDLGMGEDSKRKFLRDNAIRLFKLEGRLGAPADGAAPAGSSLAGQSS